MSNFDPKAYCEGTIKFAEQFGKTFSYKPEDIDGMEEILGILHNDYQEKKLSNEVAERIAVSLGIYLGEVMRLQKLAECGYEWEIDTTEPYLFKDGKNKMFPITKVWKHITNGIEDSVKSFYKIGILIAEGRFPME